MGPYGRRDAESGRRLRLSAGEEQPPRARSQERGASRASQPRVTTERASERAKRLPPGPHAQPRQRPPQPGLVIRVWQASSAHPEAVSVPRPASPF